MKIYKFNEHVNEGNDNEYVFKFMDTPKYKSIRDKYLISDADEIKSEYLIGLSDNSFSIETHDKMDENNFILSLFIKKKYRNIQHNEIGKKVKIYHNILTEMTEDIDEVKMHIGMLNDHPEYSVDKVYIDYSPIDSGKYCKLQVNIRLIKPHNIKEFKIALDDFHSKPSKYREFMEEVERWLIEDLGMSEEHVEGKLGSNVYNGNDIGYIKDELGGHISIALMVPGGDLLDVAYFDANDNIGYKDSDHDSMLRAYRSYYDLD